MNIDLPPSQLRFLQEQIAQGRDASEVVAEALRRYELEVTGPDADIGLHVAHGDADYAAGRYHSYATAQERRASMDRLMEKAREMVQLRAARR